MTDHPILTPRAQRARIAGRPQGKTDPRREQMAPPATAVQRDRESAPRCSWAAAAPAAPPAKYWRLLTTHKVDDAAQAEEIVQLYRLRWRIEQTFRALKSDGLALEDSQITTPERLFNLSAMAMIAALRTSQLVDARDGSPRPASDLIDEAFAPALLSLSQKLEGKTERQKNPHPPHSLAFLTWIVARLGG